MEEIKFGKQVSLFEFVKTGMIKKSKTVDNFLELHKIYNSNKNKVIKLTSQRFIFEGSEFSINISNLPKVQKKMKMILIAAIGSKNELGSEGDLIWKIPEDLKRFKELTSNHFILMGRKTFDSFGGRVLPKRYHVVITRDEKLLENENNQQRVIYLSSVEEGIEWINHQKRYYTDVYNQEKFYVIGGGEIYAQTIDQADELELTRILNEIIDVPVDAYFPVVDMNKFQIIGNKPNEMQGLKYYFTRLMRINNKIDITPTLNNTIINNLLINHLIKELD